MTEIIEVNNETDKPIEVSACRSSSSGMLYIHVGKRHGNEVKIAPKFYAQIEVKEVIS